jgi:hypothetical protein
VFAIGLEEVPCRDDWIANPTHKPGHPDPDQPVFVPKVDLKPHLIEKVSVRFKKSQPTQASSVETRAPDGGCVQCRNPPRGLQEVYRPLQPSRRVFVHELDGFA